MHTGYTCTAGTQEKIKICVQKSSRIVCKMTENRAKNTGGGGA